MAIVWKKQVNGCCYEVRSAGKSLRLYTDGIFHSQYHPDNILTGSVWDLLMLPALFLPAGYPQRVLVLGVGGGAVMHQINAFFTPGRIVGIELNSQHIYVARHFFGLKGHNVALYEADAPAWVQAYKGPGFDLIIDDLFCGEDGEAQRVLALDRFWFKALCSLLNPGGALVVNFATAGELRSSVYADHVETERDIKTVFQLTTPRCENAVAALLSFDASIEQFKQSLKTHPQLGLPAMTKKLRYRIIRV